MSGRAKSTEVPQKVALETATEIDRLVQKSGQPRIELLKAFWQAERGKSHNEHPSHAANNFKQTMFKARHGKSLGKITWQELLDFRAFLLRNLSQASSKGNT